MNDKFRDGQKNCQAPRIWFHTSNAQIIDLNAMQAFWVEKVIPHEEFHVLAKEDGQEGSDWRLGIFKSEEEAKIYLRKISLILMDSSE